MLNRLRRTGAAVPTAKRRNLRRRSEGLPKFEAKYGDFLRFIIGPPVEISPELSADLDTLVREDPSTAPDVARYRERCANVKRPIR